MSGKNRRDVLSMLAAGGVAGASLPTASTPNDDSRAQTQARYFPNVELVTHEGRKVRFYDDLIKDKIVLINFMYAECTGICPGITANLKRVQSLLGERVGRDIFMYSLTLKPKQDKPAALMHYVEMHRIKPGWTFLTGEPEDIERLRRSMGFYTSNRKLDKDLNNHIGMVRYGNEPRQWWGMCPGQAEPGWIVETVKWMDGPVRRQPQAGDGQ